MGIIKKILQYCFGLIFFSISFFAITGLIFGGAGLSLRAVIAGKTLMAIVSCISTYCFYRFMRKTPFYIFIVNSLKNLIK